jgi:hypothetical protein
MIKSLFYRFRQFLFEHKDDRDFQWLAYKMFTTINLEVGEYQTIMDIDDWLVDYCQGKTDIKAWFKDDKVIIIFEISSDAVLFKLTWCGK